MGRQEMSLPAFFVFFNHEWCTEKLTIPPSFARCIKEKLPELVVLRDKQNNMWRVSIENVGDDICFRTGWTTFMNDASLQDGDMIVFEYSFAGLFHVKLFDPSSFEKIGAKKFIFKDTDWNNERVEVEEHTEAVGEEGDDEETWEEGDNVELDEEEMNEVGIDGEDMEVAEGEDGMNDGAFVEKRSRCKRIHDIYGGKLFRAGLAVKPKNPYFITKVTSRNGELYVPLQILRNKKVKFAQVTHLVGPNGGVWTVKYKRWRDGRTMYSGGWRSFCSENGVLRDDVCICEFVKGSPGFYIKVNIVRNPSMVV